MGFSRPVRSFRAGHQAFPALGIQGHRLSGQFQINGDTPIVDFLVQMVFLPHFFWHRVLLQPLLDGHFHFHVSFVVAFEQIPFLRSMLGKVPCPAAVGLGFLAGNAEIPDQLPPFLHLLIVQLQHSPYPFQGKGQPIYADQTMEHFHPAGFRNRAHSWDKGCWS